jgi:hypothetical protein
MSRRYRFLAVLLSGAVCVTDAVAIGPLSPYKALDLPKSIHPTLTVAPVQAITAGSLSITLESTPLDVVKKEFGGKIRGAGDAGDAVSWLCYAGKDSDQRALIYWFVSNDEMSGDDHEVTQVAVQLNPGVESPRGCAVAPPNLTGISFGVPSVGAGLDAVTKQLGEGKPSARGYLGYGSEVVQTSPKDATVTQSVQYRFRHGSVTVVSVSQVTTN